MAKKLQPNLQKAPWLIRPWPGHHHCLKYGDVTRSNGRHYGVMLDHSLNVPDEFQDPSLESGQQATLIFASGRVVDIYTTTKPWRRVPRHVLVPLQDPEPVVPAPAKPKGLIELLFYP